MDYDDKEIDARVRAELDGDFEEQAEQRRQGGHDAESCDYDWPFGSRP